MMGATEPVVAENPVAIMEDIFDDLHQEGEQASMASLSAVEGEGVKAEATVRRKSPWTEAKRRRRRSRRAFPRNILLPP